MGVAPVRSGGAVPFLRGSLASLRSGAWAGWPCHGEHLDIVATFGEPTAMRTHVWIALTFSLLTGGHMSAAAEPRPTTRPFDVRDEAAFYEAVPRDAALEKLAGGFKF